MDERRCAEVPARRKDMSVTLEDITTRVPDSAGPASEVPDEGTWRAELTKVLSGQGFPARSADVISRLHQVHAPSRLLWRFAGVPAETRFSSLDALTAQLDDRSRHIRNRPTREPM